MNRKQWQFISGCVFIGMGWSAASAQVTNYNRLSLDEKVRLSTLIVMGTVTGQNEVAPFSTATRRAIVKVDTVLKGNAPEGEITIGYRSGDQWYDPNNKEWVRLQNEPIVVGKPCILFLRKAIQDAFAPVNWQMGTLPVDDVLLDPHRPALRLKKVSEPICRPPVRA